ncbi:hypothetical protein L1987_34892 [Smallanthus sonchifolius]|uniref:Uncharacterized protein n=1 Tax=Smallanthus sonchifolius TaxID=185202 RepID=A0ACB9HWA4_9ASTR|nr:hypothetical protein L1987_34892 [Smallanthus sonchifolius]
MEKFLQSTVFDRINPMAYTVFKSQNPSANNTILHSTHLNGVVLDSTRDVQPPVVATIIVPKGNCSVDTQSLEYKLLVESEADRKSIESFLASLLGLWA